MKNDNSFWTKITAFFEDYLRVDKYYYEQNGNLSPEGAQTCADYLIRMGVFVNKNDMKTEAFKRFNIILPDWVFSDVKE